MYTAVGVYVCGRKGFVLIVTINKLVVSLVKIGEKNLFGKDYDQKSRKLC